MPKPLATILAAARGLVGAPAAEPTEITILDAAASGGLTLLKAAAGDGEGEDALRTFEIEAYTGGPLDLYGFALPVVIDLAELQATGSRPVLRDHKPDRIVGHSTAVQNDGRTLKLSGVMSGVGEHAREVAETADRKFPWQASIGAKAALEYVPDRKTVKVNGRSFTGPLYLGRKAVLQEVSFVALGADRGGAKARMTAAAPGDPAPPGPTGPHSQPAKEGAPMSPELRAYVTASGFAPDDLTDAQIAVLKAAFEAQAPPAPAEPAAGAPTQPVVAAAGPTAPAAPAVTLEASADPAAAHRATLAAEMDRCDRLRSICAAAGDPKHRPEGATADRAILATAIADNWTPERTELAVLRASRPAAPAVHGGGPGLTDDVLACAAVLAAGVPLDSPHLASDAGRALGLPAVLRAGVNSDVRQRAMEAAHKFDGASLADLAAAALRMEGQHAPLNRQDLIQASTGSATLGRIFTTSVNAAVIEGYLEGVDTTAGWTREGDVPNFQKNERIGMKAGGTDLEKLPRGGTAEHAERADKGEEFKIARYAKQWSIDEQDLIDDSMMALRDTPQEFGKAARRLRPDLVYSELLANEALNQDGVALFHASHGNLGSAALDTAGLQAAITAISLQREGKVNLNLTATHLILPPALGWKGRQLLASAETRGNDAADGTVNTLRNALANMVEEARLQNGVLDPDTKTEYAGSAEDWFLAVAGVPTVLVAFLKGSGRAPRVRSYQLERGQWGQGWDVKHDIGTKALDFRGLYRSAP